MNRARPVRSSAPAPWLAAKRQTRAACSKVHIGTFSEVASARPSRMSLSSTDSAAPKAKRPLTTSSSTCSLAMLRPVPAFTMASMVSASSPALAPIASPSIAATRLVANSRLFTSFITCAWPGRSPMTNTVLPMRSCHGRSAATAAGSPAASIASVPARAPAGPPLIGASTQAMPRSASSAAMRSTGSRPMVDISAYNRTADPPAISAATASLTCGLGRQAKTISAAAATAAGESEAIAPRSANGAIAAGRGSNTCRRTSGASSRSAIGAPIWPRPRKPITVCSGMSVAVSDDRWTQARGIHASAW